jgi:hypothetical protein
MSDISQKDLIFRYLDLESYVFVGARCLELAIFNYICY